MATMDAVSTNLAATSARTQSTDIAATLEKAWHTYIVLLVLPFFVFLAALIYLTVASPAPDRVLAANWFIASLLWVGIATPAAFFLRARWFKDYWAGGVVAPADYFRGMLAIWLTLEVGGVLSLLGCALSGKMVPCLLPALAAFLLFLPFWPSGEAMVHAVGAEDDAELFKHPR